MLMPKDGAAVQMFDEQGRVPATLIVVPVEGEPEKVVAAQFIVNTGVVRSITDEAGEQMILQAIASLRNQGFIVEADPYQLWAHVKYLQGSSEPQDMSGVNLGKLEGF